MVETATVIPFDAARPAPPVDEVRARPATARVLHVINGEHYSGAERVQDLLAGELPKLGYDVGFACLKADRFPNMRTAREAPLWELSMRSKFDLAPALQLARLVRREGYKLLHTHTPRAALVGRVASLLAGVPMVHHVHSPTAQDSTRRWADRLNAVAERLSLTRASGVIGVSEAMGRYARRLGVPNRVISVVPNGVPARASLDERVRRGPWVLGAVALFRPRKGLEVLLEALGMLDHFGAPVRLLAVGGFETAAYEAEIHEHARRLGVTELIEWRGFTRDVDAELARMDLFVLPSLFGEGLPMVILEAMAAGVPVVGTDVEGVPEAIRHEVDGLIARADDPHDLARTINRFMVGEVDWSAMRESAFERQRTHFSDHSMAEGVARVYAKVLRV